MDWSSKMQHKTIEKIYNEEQLKEIRRKIMAGVLSYFVDTGNHIILSKMWEILQMDNSELVKIAHTKRNIGPVLPHTQIFHDMIYALCNKAKERDDVEELLYDLLKQHEPVKVDAAEELVRAYCENGKAGFNKVFTSHNQKKHFSDPFLIESFVCTRITASTDFKKVVEIGKAIVIDDIIENMEYALFGNDEMYLYDDIYFSDSDELVFDSVAFKKYLSKRKQELIAFLCQEYKQSVTEDNLFAFIGDKLKSIANEEQMSNFNNEFVHIGRSSGIRVIEQYGGWNWYSQITNDGSTGFIHALNYKPDIEAIIETYYKEYVVEKIMECRKPKGQSFNKVFLARECVPDTREAYISICYLYNVDILCKLFNNIKDEYYKNFSWEKITQKSLQERYDNIISSLNQDINELKNQLLAEKQRYSVFKETLRKEYALDDTALQFERSISNLSKDLHEKDLEISELKKKLENKEKYIQLLLSQEDEMQTKDIDTSALQSKRYLFVGFINEALPELRRKFPNSIFMDSEVSNINNIKVDAIVLLIKYMNHGMYYKICESRVGKEVPIIHCNTKNINTIYRKIFESIS